ncbi:MAG: erythromycin biosynthesis sensory transduction protein eryC1 [Planctomycetes bacterium GWC2_49_10]|nr:MAG: erythromycin biosynthesis sensory transduction protein eryC1 [Planctomycetes bacterium GWC2_49_10]
MILCANPAAQFQSYQNEIEAAVLKVMRSNRYILGAEVEALENEFANFIGTSSAIGVANGTDALELAIRALDIGPGDEVITVSHTAVATVAAIEAAGATPVLVDIDPDFFTLNPDQLQEVLTPKTRAVIAVHLYGQAADLDAIGKFCSENSLSLIEDGSQAHGAKWQGRRLGSIGHVGCFSCYPTKNLGAIGDAGLVATNDEALAKKIRMLREYGWQRRYISDIAGRNSRLDELQAAILRVKLRHLDADNAKRSAIAKQYCQGLDESKVKLPKVREDLEAVHHLYVIQSLTRKLLIEHLDRKGIQTGIHYPMPIYLQPAYKTRIRTAQDMSVTERLAAEVLSLPMYPELSSDEVAQVIEAVNSYRVVSTA